MKKFTILLFCNTLIFCACSKNNMKMLKIDKNPIVDYNNTDEFFRNSGKVKSFTDDEQKNTLIIVDGKSVNYERFFKIVDSDSIKTVQVFKDSSSITKLNYPYDKFKKIIVVQKK